MLTLLDHVLFDRLDRDAALPQPFQGALDLIEVLAAVAIRPKGTPEIIKEGIKISARCGMDGLSFAFYDCASYALMKAARDGMAEAEVKLIG